MVDSLTSPLPIAGEFQIVSGASQYFVGIQFVDPAEVKHGIRAVVALVQLAGFFLSLETDDGGFDPLVLLEEWPCWRPARP